jgi:hypothetical protein
MGYLGHGFGSVACQTDVINFTQNPFKELALPCCPQGKSLENCTFRYRETADFDCHRVERTSLGAGVACAEVQRLFDSHPQNREKRAASPLIWAIGKTLYSSNLVKLFL